MPASERISVIRAAFAVCAAAACLAASSRTGCCEENGAGGEGDWVLVNYDRGLDAGDFKTNYNAGKTCVVEGNSPEGNRHLRWDIEGGTPNFAIIVDLKGHRNISGCAAVSFFIRAEPEIPAKTFQVRMRTDEANEFIFWMPKIPRGWTHAEIPFICFYCLRFPSLRRIEHVSIVGFKAECAMSIFVDDFRFLKAPNYDSMRKDKAAFDSETDLQACSVYNSVLELAKEKNSSSALWKIKKNPQRAGLLCRMIPKDIRNFESFSFRIRGFPYIRSTQIHVYVIDGLGNALFAMLPEKGDEWTSVEMHLPYMRMSGCFDPENVSHLEFMMFEADDLEVGIDDIAFRKGKKSGASWEQSGWDDIDFKDPRRLSTISTKDSLFRLAMNRTRPVCIEWDIKGGSTYARLRVGGAPMDVSQYTAVKVTIMADRTTRDDELNVQLFSSNQGALMACMPVIGNAWKECTIPIAEFKESGSVDPARISELQLVSWKPSPVKILVKSIKFVKTGKPPAAKVESLAELKARMFGGNPARILDCKTAHFQILTDSKAALDSLKKSLEEMHDFVIKSLSLPVLDSPLPVFVFQKRGDYIDFSSRISGMDKSRAENSAGHGCAKYLALEFTRPDDPVVVHELTHAMVHRSLGPFGGSWLQEGFAVYVEKLYQGKDPSKEFASRLKSRNYTPLYAFFGYENLDQEKSKSDSNLARELYEQAGAFLSFLRNGPLSDKYDMIVKKLTHDYAEYTAYPDMMEKYLGKTTDEVEEMWIKWSLERK